MWLRDHGVEKSAIGLFAWIGLTYSIKFLWAPIVDRVRLPLLGRPLGQRRSWMLLAQFGIGFGLVTMAGLDPGAQTGTVALFALLVAFSSATQDITVDAYRIEAVEAVRQGAMAAAYNLGYRLAVLAGTAGALIIADAYDWATAYYSMGALALVGIVTTLIIREPEHGTDEATAQMEANLVARASSRVGHSRVAQRVAAWVTGALVSPLVEFFKRHGHFAAVLLLLIATYSISDRVMGIMANVFYREVGFSKTEIGTVAKGFGFFMTMAGVGIGGVLVAKIGNLRTMLLSVVLLAATNLMFVLLVLSGPDLRMLAVTISGDNLSQGISVVGFIAPVEPDEQGLHRDPVRAVQLADVVRRQADRGRLGVRGRRGGLGRVFRLRGADGRAGDPADSLRDASREAHCRRRDCHGSAARVARRGVGGSCTSARDRRCEPSRRAAARRGAAACASRRG